MATYTHVSGGRIETEGTVYRVIGPDGGLQHKADISRWNNSAEKWIDNDIAAGYYLGFEKVMA
jgi:hypothetical protein